MKKIVFLALVTLAASLTTPVNAGGPKESHPCYGVADCKSQPSRKEFSKCVKGHKEQADAITECAAFRKDKNGYMKEKGIDGIDTLFN
jgi:hypothetical protein